MKTLLQLFQRWPKEGRKGLRIDRSFIPLTVDNHVDQGSNIIWNGRELLWGSGKAVQPGYENAIRALMYLEDLNAATLEGHGLLTYRDLKEDPVSDDSRPPKPEPSPEAGEDGDLARWIVEQAIDWQMRTLAAGGYCSSLTQLVSEVFAAHRDATRLTRQGKGEA